MKKENLTGRGRGTTTKRDETVKTTWRLGKMKEREDDLER